MIGRLPDFVIIGAPKAGTTTLAKWLGSHPGAFVAPAKELRYFNLEFERGEHWYRSQFEGAGPDEVAGEATPAYMYSTEVLDRMAAVVPRAKLIAILREPVSRAWSNYWFLRALGVESRSIHDALEAERRGLGGPGTVPFGYLEGGRYAVHVGRVLDRFSASQLLVTFYEELVHDPASFFSEVCRHLEIDDGVPPPDGARAYNTGRMPRSTRLQSMLLRLDAERWPLGLGLRLARWNLRRGPYPSLDHGVAAQLRAEFADDNRRLQALLDRPLPESW